MFPNWRIALRKAEQALRQGQLREARRLVSSPDVRSYRPSCALAGRIGRAFVDRAERNLELGNSMQAWQDLIEAEQLEVGDKRLPGLRRHLVTRMLEEARSYLESAQPVLGLRCLQRLGKRAGECAESRKLAEAARLWQIGEQQGSHGDFQAAVQSLEQAGALLGPLTALQASLNETRSRAERLPPIESELHRALSAENWQTVLERADEVLAMAPDHKAAQTARDRAWRGVGAFTIPRREAAGRRFQPGPFESAEQEATPHAPPPLDSSGHRTMPSFPDFILWVDAVGGYLICGKPRVAIGQPSSHFVDIPVLAELSRLHAWIERDVEGYVLRAVRQAKVNGRDIDQMATLSDGDLIKLGECVLFRFRQPCSVSSTAALHIESSHRLALPVDGVILMSDSCVIGPSSKAHIVAPRWEQEQEVVLYRQRDEIWCRMGGHFEVNGKACYERERITVPGRLGNEEITLATEPRERLELLDPVLE